MSASLKVGSLSYDLTLDKTRYETGMRNALTEARNFSRNASGAFGDTERNARRSFDGIASSYRDTSRKLSQENDTIVSGSQRAFDGLEGNAKKAAGGMHGAFKTAVAGMAGMFAAMGAQALFSGAVNTVKDSIKAASDQEQAFGAVDTVLGHLAPSTKKWAAEQQKIGLSTTEASAGVTYLTSMLTNNGVALDESVKKSQTLTGLAADMAAAFGGTTKDAIDAISGALRGETDPIERYGVSMKEATLQAYALKTGLTTSKGPLDQVTRAQAAYGLMMEQTAKIQGQATREQNTYEGQLGRLKATWSNTQAEMGKAFLPVVVEGLQTLNGMMPAVGEKVQEWMPKIQDWLGKLADGIRTNWPQIKETFLTIADALERVGQVAKIVFDVFMSLPPELRTMLVTGIIVNQAIPGGGALPGMLVKGGGSLLGGLGGAGGAAGSSAGAIASGASKVAGPAAIAASAGGAVWNIGKNSSKISERSNGSNHEAAKLGLINAVDGATFGVFGLNKQLDETYASIEKSKQSIRESQAFAEQLRAQGINMPVTIDPDSLDRSENIFTSWWNGVKQLFSGWGGTIVDTVVFTFKEVMGWVWNSIKDNFDRIVNMFTQLPKMVVGAIGNFGSGLFNGVKSMLGFAGGGYVAGPGTSTSDSIPAWLSNGEYVLRADAVRRIGVGVLDRANNGYANGGLVGAAAGGGGYSIGQVTVVAQDMNGFERSLRAKQRAAALGGRR